MTALPPVMTGRSMGFLGADYIPLAAFGQAAFGRSELCPGAGANLPGGGISARDKREVRE
jgi:hypothetical protein